MSKQNHKLPVGARSVIGLRLKDEFTFVDNSGKPALFCTVTGVMAGAVQFYVKNGNWNGEVDKYSGEGGIFTFTGYKLRNFPTTVFNVKKHRPETRPT